MSNKVQAKIFTYRKQAESLQAFEQVVDEWVQSIGKVISLKVHESPYSSNVYFTFLYEPTEIGPKQNFYIVGWIDDSQSIEPLLNNCLDAAADESKKVKFINLIHANRSVRSLIAFIVEGQQDEIKETHKTENTEDQASRKDQDPNVKAKRKTKSKIID